MTSEAMDMSSLPLTLFLAPMSYKPLASYRPSLAWVNSVHASIQPWPRATSMALWWMCTILCHLMQMSSNFLTSRSHKLHTSLQQQGVPHPHCHSLTFVTRAVCVFKAWTVQTLHQTTLALHLSSDPFCPAMPAPLRRQSLRKVMMILGHRLPCRELSQQLRLQTQCMLGPIPLAAQYSLMGPRPASPFPLHLPGRVDDLPGQGIRRPFSSPFTDRAGRMPGPQRAFTFVHCL